MAGVKVTELMRIADEKYVPYTSPKELCSRHRETTVSVMIPCGNEVRNVCIHCGLE